MRIQGTFASYENAVARAKKLLKSADWLSGECTRTVVVDSSKGDDWVYDSNEDGKTTKQEQDTEK